MTTPHSGGVAERVAGALYGLAAGDVLGAGYEGGPPIGRVRRPAAGSRYTDDTQQALVLALHLLRNGRVVADWLAFDLAALAGGGGRPSAYRGIGPGFATFLAMLEDGATPDVAAQLSAGNGAAMRVAPVAIRFHDDPDRLLDQAIAASMITHAHPVGIAAAGGVAMAVWSAAHGQRGADLIHSAADAAATVEHRLFSEFYDRMAPMDQWHDFSMALRSVAEDVHRPAAELAAAVGERAAVRSATGRATGTDPYACASVVTALALAARHDPDDPTAPVEWAAGLGGDTDTMAAIAGAVVGTRIPPSAWPWKVPNGAIIAALGRSLAGGEVDDALVSLDLYELERS